MNVVISKEWGQREAEAFRDAAKQDMAWWLRDHYGIPLPIGEAHMTALRNDFQSAIDEQTPLFGDEFSSNRDRLLFSFVQDVLATRGLREVLGIQGPGGGKLPTRIVNNRTVGVTITTDKGEEARLLEKLRRTVASTNKRLKKHGLKAVLIYEWADTKQAHTNKHTQL